MVGFDVCAEHIGCVTFDDCLQSGALDQNLLPDVTVFELDLDEDSDEEILFAKAMPVR